jgi:2-methylfumaryl-CoA isomerase
MVAIAILVAERKRRESGEGEFIQIALSDVALSVVGALGRLSQAYLGSEKVSADGNFLYGAFGSNFLTKDNVQIMLVGLTPRQWSSLKDALQIHDSLSKLESQFKVNLNLEADRFKMRQEISDLIASIIKEKSLSELSDVFSSFNVSWSKYQTFQELLNNDHRASESNPIFNLSEQQGIGELPNIASPIRFTNVPNLGAQPAPLLGANTEEVLEELLKMSGAAIQDLKQKKIINQ